jgi:hypothetical protein
MSPLSIPIAAAARAQGSSMVMAASSGALAAHAATRMMKAKIDTLLNINLLTSFSPFVNNC